MQSVSGALAAAIIAFVRRPLAKLTVAWTVSGYTGDLSAYVTSLTIDRSITTDLPDATGIVSGGAAAQVTAELGGAALTKAMSPFTGGTSRLGAVVSVDLGMQGTAGAEYVPAFRGRVRSTSVSSGDRSGSLEALDGPETMRTAVTLPVFAAVDPASPSTLTGYRAPGLDGQWVMDYTLRANGLRTSPATRSSCLLSATMHGSAWPEVGTLLAAYTYGGGGTLTPQGPPGFSAHDTDGLEGFTPRVTGGTAQALYTPAGTVNANNGSTLFVEFDRFSFRSAGIIQAVALRDAFPSVNSAVEIQVGRTEIDVYVTRGGVTSSPVVFTYASVGAGDHYVGVHVTFTAAGFDVRARVNGTSYGPTSGTVGTSAGNPSLVIAQVFSTVHVLSGVQVTTEAFSGGMWNDGFAATAALESSLNKLVVMPAVESRAPWQLLQEVASAEQGVALFDESGVFRFYNRTHMTGGAAVATITAASNLKTISASEAVDDVRNIVRVPASPLTTDIAAVELWRLSESIVVPASGSVEINAAFDGPAVALDTSVAYDSGVPVGQSAYRAAKNSDGTGGDVSNLSITVTQYPARARVFVTNPNAFDVWIVNNSLATGAGDDQAGAPHVILGGRLARAPEAPYLASVTDATSVTTYGEQAIDVDENPWRQASQAANDLAAALLARLKDPHPVLSGVEIVADPRLQLADRVRVVDTAGLALDADCWLLGITTRYDAGGIGQSVTLRQV